MTTKQTLRERVKTFLANHPNGETAATIHKCVASKQPMQSVYSVLWQMRKHGEVRHDAELGKYYPVTSRVETKPAEVSPEEVDEYTMENLFDVIDGMNAIIRYLESRIEDLIRKQVV